MDSTTLFALRREAKDLSSGPKITALLDLKMQGLKLVAFDSDEWNQKALAHILVDLCNLLSAARNFPEAQNCYNELTKLTTHDDYINSRQDFLKRVVDPHHGTVTTLNQKSKDGHHDEAIDGFRNMIAANQLGPVHHETLGWAIYRLLKAKSEEYTSVQVRQWLKYYLDLKNDRPSMVHSQILNWTMKYAAGDPNLRTMDFLKIWDARNLSPEDVREGDIDGQAIPSLFTRLCRKLVADPHGVDVHYLMSTVDTRPGYRGETNEVRIIDELRQQVFWQILTAGNENRFSDLWPLLDNYLTVYATYPASHWNSEILQLAERFTKDEYADRFLPFFKSWNPVKLRPADWKETKNGEATYPPLAQKALKKAAVVALKKATIPGSLDWLITACTEGVKQLPQDEYLPRNRAQLLKHNGQADAATAAYRDLTLTLGDKYYVWKEFADLMDEEQLPIKAGMLAKALAIERNEDYIGEVRLSMATYLLRLERPAEASLELEAYHAHRVEKGWKIDEQYAKLKIRLGSLKFEPLVRPNYAELIAAADEYAYAAVPWTKMALVDRWKDDKGRDKVKLYADKETTLSVIAKRFQPLKKERPGITLEVKLHKGQSKDGTEVVYRPLILRATPEEPWTALPLVYAIIDYVNEDKKIIHAVTQYNQPVFFPAKLLPAKAIKGHFLSGRILTEIKKEKNVGKPAPFKLGWKSITVSERLSLLIPQPIPGEIAEAAFPEFLCLVDSVNTQKELFHFVTKDKTDGIVRFSDTDLRPVPGDHFTVRGYTKVNKKTGKTRLNILSISPTKEVLSGKIKHLSGEVRVTYKGGGKTFGFVNDIYVPGYMLDQAGIFNDCQVSATAIESDGKWRVVTIECL
jgi:hypothetical protein